MTDTKVGSLEDEALKRKERLKNLKRKAEPAESSQGGGAINIPKPIFRNYKPANSDESDVIPELNLPDIEAEVKTQLETMQTPLIIEEIDITNLAPRKPDWDLKRDVAKKLQKLERRTQKAIAELIRERLKEGQENILQIVNVGTASAIASGPRPDDDEADEE